MSRPIAVDLFSGAGGLSLGFEQAGFDVVAAVEYDPVHAATHLFNFPSCEMLCRDIERLSADTLLEAAKVGFRKHHPGRRWPGHIDVLIGGPPCQGFSLGGKRDQGDERNELFFEFVRFVEELRPTSICLENVAGLLEPRFANLRDEAFARLRSAGYELSGTTDVLNSLDFGVPQVRRRMIVLGTRHGVGPGRPRATGQTISVSAAFEGLPSPFRYPALLESDEVELSKRDAVLRRSVSGSYAQQLAGLILISKDRSRPRSWKPNVLTNSRRTRHQSSTIRRFAATEPGSVEPKSRLYRLPIDGPSRTLRAGTGAERGAHTSPRPIHPAEDRVITVREAARLHGYPDWFRFHTTNWHGHRQIGNSVPPPLARAAAEELLLRLGRRVRRLRTLAPSASVALLQLSRSSAAEVVSAVPEELPDNRRRVLGPDSDGLF